MRFIFLLFIISLFLRFYLIPQNLFFGPEQGIDFQVISDIVNNHKITLIGAKTDISGVFHGPIYYYLSAIPFYFTNGNPVVISWFLILLNSLSIFPLYLIGRRLGGERLGIIIALIFTVSFDAIVFSRWLSSQPLTIPFSAMFAYLYFKFLDGDKKALLPSVIFLGLLCQAEFLNLLFFAVIFLASVIVSFKKYKKTNLSIIVFSFILLVFFSVGNYVLFDFRHQFLISKSIISLFTADSGYHRSFLETFLILQKVYTDVFTKSIFPMFTPVGLILLLISLVYLLKKSIDEKNEKIFLLFYWMVIPFMLLLFLHHDVIEQFLVLIIVPGIIGVSLLINTLFDKKYYLGFSLLAAILFINTVSFFANIPNNYQVFFQTTQPESKLKDQKAVIEEIYKDANGKPFGFHAFTIPYDLPQGWNYLFEYYGRKYGYQPSDKDAKIMAIITQANSDEKLMDRWYRKEVHADSKILKKFTHGIFTVTELDFSK